MDLRFEDSVFSDNTANPTHASGNYVGGAIYALGSGALDLVNSQVINNEAASRVTSFFGTALARGGGIFSSGVTVTLDRTSLVGNTTFAIEAVGGSGEHTDSYGGGFYLDSGSLLVLNSIISDNITKYSGEDPTRQGSGIYVNGGTAEIINSTLAYNSK